MTTNCFYSQDVPEPLHSMVSKEPLVMLDDERGYPLEACRGIGVMLLFTALLALIGACVWAMAGCRAAPMKPDDKALTTRATHLLKGIRSEDGPAPSSTITGTMTPKGSCAVGEAIVFKDNVFVCARVDKDAWSTVPPSVRRSRSYRFLVGKFGAGHIAWECDPQDAADLGVYWLYTVWDDSPEADLRKNGSAIGHGATLQAAMDEAAAEYIPGPEVARLEDARKRAVEHYQKMCKCR